MLLLYHLLYPTLKLFDILNTEEYLRTIDINDRQVNAVAFRSLQQPEN